MKPALTLFTLILLCSALRAQNENPTIAVCDGKQYVCTSDSLVTLCVNIIVNPNYPHANVIKEFVITWGDGSPKTVVPGSTNPPSQTHVYNVGSLYDSCVYKEYNVKLETHHTNPNIQSTNSAFYLNIRIPPRPQITFSTAVACTGMPVVMKAIPCPTEGVTLQTWDLGDGTRDTGFQITHTYTTPGQKTITYCIGNDCDTVCATYLYSVVDQAQAHLTADSGVLTGYASPYRVCLDTVAGSEVVVNALNSTGVSKPYEWSISPNTGWAWMEPDSLNLGARRVRFTKEGNYTVRVKVNNICNIESEATIQIRVIKGPSLILKPARDTCVAISYTPFPFNANATYRINGVVHTSFPVQLPISATPYIVEATLENECGLQVIRDTFAIKPADEITIYAPADTTRVCVGSDSIPLRASLPGIWSGPNNMIKIVGPDTLFYPQVPGLHRLIVSCGLGVCRRSDTTHVLVEEVYPLQLTPPPPACMSVLYTPAPFDPKAQYYINGLLPPGFPVSLSSTGSPHLITAVAHNTCGEVRDSVRLYVVEPVDVFIEAPNDTLLCSGTAFIPLRASDTVGTWVGANIELTPQGPVFNPKAPGTFPLIFERGPGACRRADTVVITVIPGDSVKAGPDRYVCITQNTLTLSGFSPSNGVFSGFGLNGLTIDLAALQPDTPYLYTYTVPQLPPGCNTDAMTLVAATPPESSFSSSDDTTCVGYSVLLTPSANGNVYFEVNWGDGSTGANLSHVYQTPGTYAVQFTAYTLDPLTGNRLCSAEGATSVHVLRPMVADSIRFWVKPDSGCAPLTVAFENVSAAENARYEWDFGNGQTYQGYQPGVVVFQQGIEDTVYYVRLTVRNLCDTFVREEAVRVKPQPKAALGVSYLSPCSGDTIQVSTLSTGNPVVNTLYTSTGWEVSASRDKPSLFQFFTDSLPATVRIWLVSANECGTDTAHQDIEVRPTDVYSLIGLPDTTRLCIGDSIRLVNLSTVGAPVRWVASNNFTSLMDTTWVVFSQAGTHQVVLYAYGCGYDSSVQALTIHPLPVLSVAHDPAKCPGDTVLFNATTNGPGFWMAFGDGDTSTMKSARKVYSTPGTYPLSAQAISEYGCKISWSGSIHILTPPKASAAADDSLCVGAPALFSGNSSTPGAACLWNFGDGNTADACASSHAYAAPGLYTAMLTIVSPEGCRDSDKVLVYVRTRPQAQFSYAVDKLCSPALVRFESQAVNATGLNWHLGDGTTSTTNALQHTYARGGAYTVYLVASNEGICFDTAQQTVVVYQTPEILPHLEPQCTVEEGTDLTILTPKSNYVEVTGAGYQLHGDYHPALPSGTYLISITTPEGCHADTSIFVLPPDELVLWLEKDSFDIRLGEQVQLQAKVNQTGTVFAWSPALHLNRPDVPNPIAAPWRQSSYVVTATNAAGCTKADTVWINVHINRTEGLFIPTGFSPNSDGVNDIFYVRCSNPAVESFDRFQIFDKYDEKVFDVKELPKGVEAGPENPLWGWDGTFRGSKAEMGAYRYVIELRYVDGEVLTLTGIIHLLR